MNTKCIIEHYREFQARKTLLIDIICAMKNLYLLTFSELPPNAYEGREIVQLPKPLYGPIRDTSIVIKPLRHSAKVLIKRTSIFFQKNSPRPSSTSATSTISRQDVASDPTGATRNSRGQCYKTFSVRDLRIFVISYGVCAWQAFPH